MNGYHLTGYGASLAKPAVVEQCSGLSRHGRREPCRQRSAANLHESAATERGYELSPSDAECHLPHPR